MRAAKPKRSERQVSKKLLLQKRQALNADEERRLKSRGLIEGRKPSYFIAKSLAQQTGQKARYIKNLAFDKRHYLDLICRAVKEHGSLARKDIDDPTAWLHECRTRVPMDPRMLSESAIEAFAIKLLVRQGYTYVHGPALAPDSEQPERSHYGEVLLDGRLTQAARRINDRLPVVVANQAVKSTLRAGSPELLAANERPESGVAREWHAAGGDRTEERHRRAGHAQDCRAT